MKILISLLLIFISLTAESILIINSNSKVKKYSEAQKGFENTFKGDVKSIDLCTMTQNEVKDYLYDEYPDIVYTIGSRAYQYAYKYIPEKKIFFSNIINWERLPSREHYAGVLAELHFGMQLSWMKMLSINTKKIAVLYSKYTEAELFLLKKYANKMNIKIISKKIKSNDNLDIKGMLEKSDSMLIIPDPIVLKDESAVKYIFMLAKEYKKPVVTYDRLFINYGAILSISVDNQTTGRQIAIMLNKYINKEESTNIQYPMGSRVVFNKKVADKLDIKAKNLDSIEEVIE